MDASETARKAGSGQNAGATAGGGDKRRELGLRIVSAIVLAVVAIGLTLGGSWTFAILVGGVALVVGWEWGHIVRSAGIDGPYAATAVAVLAAVVATTVDGAPWALMAIGAGALAAAALARSEHRAVAGFGVLYAGLPAVALVWLMGAPAHGLAAILLLLLVVWATDIGAFIAGRSLGGPKLWPRVSPNKTWSGLAGGVASAALVGGAFAASIDSAHPVRVAALAALLGLISQGGDLFESAVKRRHGVKDASHLIPGHGGFMDRVDGLIAAAVAAALVAAVVAPAAPAAALLGLVP